MIVFQLFGTDWSFEDYDDMLGLMHIKTFGSSQMAQNHPIICHSSQQGWSVTWRPLTDDEKIYHATDVILIGDETLPGSPKLYVGAYRLVQQNLD